MVDIAYIVGHHNPADILTKGDIASCNIESNSTWQKGFPLMLKDKTDMPLVYFKDLSLSKSEATVPGKFSVANPIISIVTWFLARMF